MAVSRLAGSRRRPGDPQIDSPISFIYSIHRLQRPLETLFMTNRSRTTLIAIRAAQGVRIIPSSIRQE